MKIKTSSDLKYYVDQTGSYFFTRKTMSFFGDTMKNYGLITHIDCYEVYRKHPVKHGLDTSTFFNKETFKQILDR